MDSAIEHNKILQNKGRFSAIDLEENRHGRFSAEQIEQIKNARAIIKNYAEKFDNKKPVISIIFGAGFLFFCVVLYFVGLFDTLQNILGLAFFPAMLCAVFLAGIMIFLSFPVNIKPQ